MIPGIEVVSRNVNSKDPIRRNVGTKMGLLLGMSGINDLCLWPKVVARSLPSAMWFKGQKDACAFGSFLGPSW